MSDVLAERDAAALALLDRLLEANEPERARTLAGLIAEDPPLHARVRRLLAACDAGGDSRLLAPLAPAPDPANVPGLAPGAVVGGHVLLRELGRGGSAVVWLARRDDGLVRREVALKMPLFALTSAVERARFERERALLAALEHPGIARLYDAGIDAAGRPYLVLERVDGEPITHWCDRARLGLRARVALFLQVLAAVGHAHAHMVVHRDLKPSNVLVDAAGRVRLLDFGVAKLLGAEGAEAQLTRDAGCALTPRYAAPEQIEPGTISARTDVYALGVLLHELLCGAWTHAAPAESIARVMHAVLHEAARPASRSVADDAAAQARGFERAPQLGAALAGDLDTVAAHALRKVPAERYASVERLADDLGCWLAYRPIAARRPSMARRLLLFARRHRAATAIAAAGAAVVLALAGLLGRQHLETVAQRERAEAARDFLLDLVEVAEPDAGHAPGEVTGAEMLRKGLASAHARFAGQPRLLGEVLAELARTLDRLGDDERADAALREADALLRAHAPAGDAVRMKVQAQRAGSELADGHVDEARTLAAGVVAGCDGEPRECAQARTSARTLLATVAGMRGEGDHGVAELRRAVADAEQGFGPAHAETALAWDRLAVVARNADDLRLADSASARAVAIAAGTNQAAQDARDLRRTRALVDLDLGRVAQAQSALQALAGEEPEGLEAARIARFLSIARRLSGDAEGALSQADRALALAAPFAHDPERWAALQAHALALDLAGRSAEARAEIARVRLGLAAEGQAPGSMAMRAARRFEAEIRARAGDAAGSARALDALIALPSDDAPLELAQALDARGALFAANGRGVEALALHERARALYAPRLPDDHPWRRRNALYLARAQARALPEAAPRAALP